MGRRGADRLVARSRPREPDDARRPRHPDLRHRYLEADDQGRAPSGASSPAGLADLAVHARRAGRADRHRQDRADRARPRSKFYAATQVMDEARHVEAYSRLLHEKFELAYPITHGLSTLLEQGLSDSRWDMTYLTMQILIEGLALAAFQRIRDQSKNPLAAAVNAYVMQDEARHVAFGRIALRDYYPQLSDAERSEREEFVVDACWHMRDRFNQLEVWQRLGLPIEECPDIVDRSEAMKLFRSRIFSRIVPTVRDIGLWGQRVQEAFAAMGAIEFADVDAGALLDNDARVADEFDARLRVRDAPPQ